MHRTHAPGVIKRDHRPFPWTNEPRDVLAPVLDHDHCIISGSETIHSANTAVGEATGLTVAVGVPVGVIGGVVAVGSIVAVGVATG